MRAGGRSTCYVVVEVAEPALPQGAASRKMARTKRESAHASRSTGRERETGCRRSQRRHRPRSVLIRSPGLRGTSAGAITWQWTRPCSRADTRERMASGADAATAPGPAVAALEVERGAGAAEERSSSEGCCRSIRDEPLGGRRWHPEPGSPVSVIISAPASSASPGAWRPRDHRERTRQAPGLAGVAAGLGAWPAWSGARALAPTPAEPAAVTGGGGEIVLPHVIVEAGPAAVARFLFFAGRIANARTRAAYGRAVGQFLAWCEASGCATSPRSTWPPTSGPPPGRSRP